jgi:PKD domain-containing protein
VRGSIQVGPRSVSRRGPACVLLLRMLTISFLVLTAVLCAAQTSITPTTTLAIESGNNTSAASSFTTQNNGNAGASNVSKVSLRSLLYPGSTTKIYAHLLPWFGQPKHISVGYNSDDPAQMTRQVSDMLSRGVQGAIIDWYGPSSTRSNQTALNLKSEAETRRGAFEFAIQEDAGALADAARQAGCDVTQQLISDLTYAANTFEQSPAYMRIDGRPIVFFFDVTKYYVDWERVRAALPLNPLFISRNRSAFALTQSNGAFSWLAQNRNDPYDLGMAYLDDFYTAALSSPAQFAFGSVYKGFNDALASWGTNRFMHQQCGKAWLASFAEIGRFYSSSNQLNALQLVTWNDYEEGTEVETGIDNCLSVLPTISGQTVSWTIPPNPAAVQRLGALQVDESTVDHYTVFISTDGQNLMPLADVPAGTHALDLSQFGLDPVNYILYVKAVGKPSIQNKMSPSVSFNPIDKPPVVSLSVLPGSGAAPLSVTASTASSTDPDGSISHSQIDFGDGTVLNGPATTHTYAAPGPYTVFATVIDNAGLSAHATSTVNVAALSQPGVSISSPSEGASLPSDIHVIANAVTQQPISSFSVSLDGQAIYRIAAAHIDTNLKLSPGAHALQIDATDAAQATVSSTVDVTVQGTTPPPVAELGLSTVSNTPPNTVLACTAGSTGFISSSSIDFGDGTAQNQMAALHTYGDSQPHDVTATITDVDGVTSLATATADGTGPNFAFGLSPANASLHAGQQTVINLNISSTNGPFNNAVVLACPSGLPAGAACTFSPSAVMPGNSTATSTLTISTSAATAGLQTWALRKMFPLYALWIGLPGLIFTSLRRKATLGRRWIDWFATCVFLSVLALQVACGGGGSSSLGSTQSQTQAGTYKISVSASSGNVQHSIPVTLTVE